MHLSWPRVSEPHCSSRTLGISLLSKFGNCFCHMISLPIYKSDKWWKMKRGKKFWLLIARYAKGSWGAVQIRNPWLVKMFVMVWHVSVIRGQLLQHLLFSRKRLQFPQFAAKQAHLKNFTFQSGNFLLFYILHLYIVSKTYLHIM